MPINPQDLVESTFHKRVSIVITDLLNQLGINNEKIRMLKSIVKTVSDIPPFVFSIIGIEGNKVEGIIKEISPFLEYLNEEEQIEFFIDQLPEEKILYFINQVITRLEWVKNGNEETTNESEVDHAEGGYTSE